MVHFFHCHSAYSTHWGSTFTAKQKQKDITTVLLGIFEFTASHIAVTTLSAGFPNTVLTLFVDSHCFKQSRSRVTLMIGIQSTNNEREPTLV